MNYSFWVALMIGATGTIVAVACAAALKLSRWHGRLPKPALTGFYVGMLLTMAAFIGQPENLAHAGARDLLGAVMVGCMVALATVHVEGMKAYERGLDPEPPHAKKPIWILLVANAVLMFAVLNMPGA